MNAYASSYRDAPRKVEAAIRLRTGPTAHLPDSPRLARKI
jgi:hypothetical protein